jgi:hypothetical protein
MLSGKHGGRGVVIINGYELAYLHRGSWKARRSVRGIVLDEIPVAWDKDWTQGKPPVLKVWFKDFGEALSLINSNQPFTVAVAKRKPGGASSEDINRLFEVKPVQALPDQDGLHGLLCEIIKPCLPPGGE